MRPLRQFVHVDAFVVDLQRCFGDHFPVGEIGFGDFQRTLEPSFGDTPEAGWALAPNAHGKGYASEALAAVLAWGEQHFGPDARTVCMINIDNAASVKVAEKMGFAPFAYATYRNEPVILFERKPS